LMAALQDTGITPEKANEEIESRITEILRTWMGQLDPNLPTILTAHGSVQGAVYGNERTVMLGKDLVLPGSLVKDARLDYAALGHIHKYQNLNPDAHPPVIYPGSIERVDFGEAADEKYFIIADIEKGKTTYEARKLDGRRFIDLSIKINTKDKLMEKVLAILPSEEKITDAVLRLVVQYPKDMETFLDETVLREKCINAFEFHLVRRSQEEARMRLSADGSIANLTPLQLLTMYWSTVKLDAKDTEPLQAMASSIIQKVSGNDDLIADSEEIQ
jgi:DNA repair protein SbcD/Mre11